jgi:hypothetical protein
LKLSLNVEGELLKFVFFYFFSNIKVNIRCCFVVLCPKQLTWAFLKELAANGSLILQKMVNQKSG